MNSYEALRRDAAWIDLSERGKIRVTGEDRARLLHAMSTNDVKDLQPGHGLYAFFLTAQGRILADACIYNLGESLLLDTEPETDAKLRDHLDKYIIADDAELADETAEWAVLSMEGPQSYARAALLGVPVQEKAYSVSEWNGGFVSRVASSSTDGIRLFVPQESKSKLVERLDAAGLPEASREIARVVRIENGIPRYGEDISERYLVQETQAMHAVHFNKGCYLGQEIVERVRSRAQVHRHLSTVRIKDTRPPAPGTKLVSDGNNVAEITSAVFSPEFNEVAALAYVRTEALASKPPMFVAETDPPVSVYLP